MVLIATNRCTLVPENELIWLTDSLKSKVKIVFEPKYGRKLSEAEVFEIASNIVSFFEPLLGQRSTTHDGK